MFQPFTFIFYKGTSTVSKIIKKFTNSNYSHLAMTMDHIHIVQLDYKTPVSIQHFNYKDNSYDVYGLTIELSDGQKEAVLDFIKRNISTSYDWKFILSRFFNLIFGTKIVSSENRYNCDELIVAAFQQIGLELIPDNEMLSPEALSKSKYLTKIN